MRALARRCSVSLAPSILPIRFAARLSFPPEVSPRFHPHSSVAVATVPIGVLDTRGAAISVAVCGVPIAWFSTTSRDLAVTPTRRFRISRKESVPFR